MFKFGKKIFSLFQKKIDEETLEDLERVFYEADLGSELSSTYTEKVRTLFKKNSKITSEEILNEIKKEIVSSLLAVSSKKKSGIPHVIFVIGVNGNGKTTTVAKLANHYKKQGKKVLIGAADTFRAAAVDQLEIWSERLGVEMVKGKPKSDPAAVTFDTIQAAISRKSDVVIIDTAGRLHTRSDLLQELEKMVRVANKALPEAPHETLLTLDATVGQNALTQAEIFHQFAPLSGLILTKMDGTAKGGTAIAIQRKLKLPIEFLGTGESFSDLSPFDANSFVDSLF